MNRELSLEFVRVTEAAAIACGHLVGRGDKNGADGLLRGHFAGHALHMLSQAYAETGEEAILNKINEFVSGLKECRDSLREMKYNGKARYSHQAHHRTQVAGHAFRAVCA